MQCARTPAHAFRICFFLPWPSISCRGRLADPTDVGAFHSAKCAPRSSIAITCKRGHLALLPGTPRRGCATPAGNATKRPLRAWKRPRKFLRWYRGTRLQPNEHALQFNPPGVVLRRSLGAESFELLDAGETRRAAARLPICTSLALCWPPPPFRCNVFLSSCLAPAHNRTAGR